MIQKKNAAQFAKSISTQHLKITILIRTEKVRTHNINIDHSVGHCCLCTVKLLKSCISIAQSVDHTANSPTLLQLHGGEVDSDS